MIPPHGVPSRRDFLTRTSSAAAALAALSAGARAHAQSHRIGKAPEKAPLAPDETLRIGVIGAGGMGGGHIRGMVDAAKNGRCNAQVVALAEVCKPRLERNLTWLAENQPEVQVAGYRTHQPLLERDDIHCVLVASPEHWHAHHAVDAMNAGKDVYLEKPMTLRLDEALWLYRYMDANPHMRLQIGTQYMMLSKYRAAREMIAAGEIGHPVFSQTSYCRNSRDGEWLYGIDPNVQPGDMLDWEAWCGPLGERDWDTEVFHRWRRYKDWSTGIVGDLLVHMMTPLVYALDAGWPTRVTATGGHYIDKAMENHDQVNLTVQFEKDHTMIVAGSTCNEQGLETMIRGHEATLYLGSDNCVLRPERLFVDDVEARTVEGSGGDVQDQLRIDWMNSVRTREMNVSTVDLATKVMVVVDLATRSMWEGSAFRFDPSDLSAHKA